MPLLGPGDNVLATIGVMRSRRRAPRTSRDPRKPTTTASPFTPTATSAERSAALEKLLAYGARGAFSHQRLTLLDPSDEHGDLVYTLKTPWSDGTEAIRLSSSELIEKLVALVPPPYVHLSRYFGVLSSHSKWRRRIVLRPHVKKGFVAVSGTADPARLTWARLLARVFAVDISRCPACGSAIRSDNIESVSEPLLIARILLALGLFGRAPARAPPRSRSLFDDIDQREGLGE